MYVKMYDDGFPAMRPRVEEFSQKIGQSLDKSGPPKAQPAQSTLGASATMRRRGPFRAIDKPPGSLPLMGKETLCCSSLLAPLNLMLVPRVLGFRGWLPSQRGHYTHFCLSRPESEISFFTLKRLREGEGGSKEGDELAEQ